MPMLLVGMTQFLIGSKIGATAEQKNEERNDACR